MTREIANRHWSDAFEDLVADLGGEFRRYGAVDAFLGNLPLPFANGCLVLTEADPADLDHAISWVKAGQVPFQVRVDESVLRPLSEEIGRHALVRDPEVMPALVLRPIPQIPAPGAGLAVERVARGTYGAFVGLMVASGISAEYATQIFPERLIEANEAIYFLARLEGRAVGISVAVRTGESGGIYSVATLPNARRCGVGTAATWAAVKAIREWGCDSAVLQSSVMGYPVYRAMGFEEVVRYVRFMPASSPPRTAP
jgi:GNAT superfamily N-acetyltransferase